ncbi:hypothetical protein B0A49_05071 [Cryomyces minteri]|uniref:Xylanolytic transcriptional activator regulatory domain-containing protein n=1 Tax=Cryomyces minteri TaxID=331657 RepID=A0A4U0X4L2_9PEZI|nr:hypothetical protein B0A49_05071 [Cryomyces minteri]
MADSRQTQNFPLTQPTLAPKENQKNYVFVDEYNRHKRVKVSTYDLSEALGELRIDHTATAPYITNQKKSLAEAPAVEEYEIHLPPHISLDLTVRIPPEMMPLDYRAMQYFDYFFTNIHPYVPVINRSYFYQQWHADRGSISPLILEGIFACSSRFMDGPVQGDQWLALASRHEESFKDVPRLSTIQAMLLILKAREAVPKRGYYYRSWMTVVNLVAMAKDLDLHEHHEVHQNGESCGSSTFDCATKTRVWHTLFVVELMIGGAQNRSDFGVSLETVNFDIPGSIPGLDETEVQVSRQFSYFMRSIRNVQQTMLLFTRLKKTNKDWPIDPAFTQHNRDFLTWITDLPQDLQLVYPSDGSSPWTPSHFVANMHAYHDLSVIMHHRPQLQFATESGDISWKHHMTICYNSAKNLCRLQESILRNFGLTGLLCMQRGINFTIYCILTCNMLHLVAFTSPDPEVSSDARDFFERHMRILEQCTSSWPMPEMQAQINALREAFSADTSKPFELKPSFPFGSPSVSQTSLATDGIYRPQASSQGLSFDHPGQAHYNPHPMTPPLSAGGVHLETDSSVAQSLAMMATGQTDPQPRTQVATHVLEPAQWNPTRIFDQWNTAFGLYDLPTSDDTTHSLYLPRPNILAHGSQTTQHLSQLPSPVAYAPPAAPYVTPFMWQDAVASSFGGSQKRGWDYGGQDTMDQTQIKRPR